MDRAALLVFICAATLAGGCSLVLGLEGPDGSAPRLLGDAARGDAARPPPPTEGRGDAWSPPGAGPTDAARPDLGAPDAGQDADLPTPDRGLWTPTTDGGWLDDPCGVRGCTWRVGDWGDCDTRCGPGTREREVVCVDGSGAPAESWRCEDDRPPDVETLDCTVPDVDYACIDETVWWFDGCGEPSREWFSCERQGGCHDGGCRCADRPGGHICCWTVEEYTRYGGCVGLEAAVVRERSCPDGPTEASDCPGA